MNGRRPSTPPKATMNISSCPMVSQMHQLFQSLINKVFKDIINQFVIAYIDDILIYSTTLEDHVHHVRTVLTCLLQNNFYVKLRKCVFHCKNLTFLGYEHLPEAVEIDQTKVQAVTNWPEPASVKDLQSFLGFVELLSTLYQEFCYFKFKYCLPPNLSPEGWMLLAVGSVQFCPNANVTQENCNHVPTTLGSFTAAEVNYNVGNHELMSIKAALEEWCHWLEGAWHPFLVRLNPLQARWALFFMWFQFSVTYRPGSKNGKADALSCQLESRSPPLHPDPILPSSLILAPIQWSLVDEIRRAHAKETPPATYPPFKLYVPTSLRPQVMQWNHESPSNGHPGIHRTARLIQHRFWWPSLCHDIKVLVIIDRFLEACKLVRLKDLPTTLEATITLFHQVFQNYGLPTSDRGPQFTSQVWQTFCTQLGISMSLSSGYHPQSNDQAERPNQEIGRFLRSYCSREQHRWTAAVSLVWGALGRPRSGPGTVKKFGSKLMSVYKGQEGDKEHRPVDVAALTPPTG
ncbi:hypothetical protein QTP86_024515 [Hemibagrus guttatus]|nr:hypothetical protein QTP86_024515 [Hemibagrus guttatus]